MTSGSSSGQDTTGYGEVPTFRPRSYRDICLQTDDRMIRYCRSALTLLISLCALFVSGDMAAQDLPTRYPLLEHFTNTPCSICGSQNPGFFNRLEAYDGQYHHVSFWPGIPYSSCIFYQANISENTARKNFYPQIVSSPDVAINGIEFKSPASITNSILDGLVGGSSWLSLEVSETTGSARNVTIALTDHVGGSLDNGLLFAVIAEREIMYNAPNGETLHHNVFREFLTSTDGDPVDLSTGTAVLTYTYDVSAVWQEEEIYVVAWLTPTDSREVINSGTKFDPLVTHTREVRRRSPLEIYPNPASQYVMIELPSRQDGILRVHDITGRLVYQRKAVSATKLMIPVAGWPAGSYYVELAKADSLMNGRFEVVQ